MHTGFWWLNLKERDHLDDRCRWEENIEMDFQDVRWTGSIWLRIGTDGGLLCMR